MSAPPLFRLVRHLGDGAREVVAEPLQLRPEEVAEVNRALVRTHLRIWPVTALAPLRGGRSPGGPRWDPTQRNPPGRGDRYGGDAAKAT
jgi:hypothetical protein